jgi:hypothetical protein
MQTDRSNQNDSASLIDELDTIDPESIRSRVMDVAGAKPPPPLSERTSFSDYRGPLFAALIAAVVIAAVVLASLLSFSSRIRNAEMAVSSYLGGEGLVLAEYRRQTDEMLLEKDRTIMAALGRLSTLESERRELDALVAARVQQREDELAVQLEAELEAERERLRETGLSDERINEEIVSLQDEGATEAALILESYRAEVEQTVRDRATELQRAEADAQSALELATIERSVIIQQSADVAAQRGSEGSEVFQSISAARRELQASGSNRTVQSVVDPGVAVEVEQRRQDIADASARETALRAEISDLQTVSAGLRAELASLRRSLSSDQTGAELVESIAELEAEVARLETDRRILAERAEAADRVARELDSLQTQYRSLQRDYDALEAEGAATGQPATETRLGAVAEQARTQALRDVLDAVRVYQVSGDPGEVTQLLGLSAGDRRVAEEFAAELGTLVSDAQRAVLNAQLEYRPLGTVSLTRDESLTVQRLVTLSISSGLLAEVRRTTASGETETVARGVVSEVESQVFSITLSEVTPGLAPRIGDRVFVAVPR